MIVKENGKFVVKSSDGSKVLGTYSTKKDAIMRLKQVEYFKNKPKTK